MVELVTRQLLVGNFRQPGLPRPAVERQGILKHPGPPLGADEHNKRDVGRLRGRYQLMYTHPVWVPHLLRNTTCYYPGYSHRGNSKFK